LTRFADVRLSCPLDLNPDDLLIRPKEVERRDDKGVIPQRVREYVPSTDFFLRVATEVEPNPDSILSFVSRYGMLEGAVLLDCTEAAPTGEPINGFVFADTLHTWSLFLRHLKQALDQVATIDDARREGRQTVSRVYKGDKSVVAQPLEQAEDELDHLITQNLYDLFSGSFSREREPGAPEAQRRFSIRPIDLRSFVWLQLATTLDAGNRIHRCKACQRWLISKSAGTGDPRVVCSQRCRTRLWIARKAQAIQLHTAGKTTAQIAQELGVNIKSVETWVGAAKGKRRPRRLIHFEDDD